MASSNPNEHVKVNQLFDVSHVTALVTGGGSGIGLMITQALVQNGAKVYITGRRHEPLNTVDRVYDTGPGQIIPLPGDVSDKQDIIRLAKEVESKEPNGIQLLVNNAGVARDDNTRAAKNEKPDPKDAKAISDHFMRSELSQWEETFGTNVYALYFMSMAFLPLLAKGQEKLIDTGYTSSVVNVSSISGTMKGTSGMQFAYAASKAAATHVSKMLATEFVGTKVRVNTIAPGVFPSEMTAGESDEYQKSHIDPSGTNPAERKGKDSDMAATILFLAGRGGVFYNHQVMYPDGGNTLTQPASN